MAKPKSQDPTGTGFCPSCNKEVDAYLEDVGIGSYEYWGQRCVDTRMAAFCCECDEEVDDYDDFEESHDEP